MSVQLCTVLQNVMFAISKNQYVCENVGGGGRGYVPILINKHY